MTAILDFGAVGGFIAGSVLVAWVLEWFSLLALMSLMPLPARPAPKTVSIASESPWHSQPGSVRQTAKKFDARTHPRISR
jgi:hypothetical protein